jgi:hypothetical protein
MSLNSFRQQPIEYCWEVIVANGYLQSCNAFSSVIHVAICLLLPLSIVMQCFISRVNASGFS